MIQLLFCGSTSAAFELQNDSPYSAGGFYTVLVDGEERQRGDTNVFSVFGLTPDADCTVTVRFVSGGEESVSIHTKPETCCVSVRDFGARGDGVHEDTAAIQAAINCLPEGGRLLFPAGWYLTLPLTLKSHMTLELAPGSVLLGSPQKERYPILPGCCKDPVTGGDVPMTGFEGCERDSYQSLLHASYAKDIRIVGKGIIDGNGQNGGWWKDFERLPAARPRVIFLNRCEDVVIHGITVANGPAWHIHPFFSREVSVLDVSVRAPKNSPNTDAVNPESCSGVNIIGCRFSVGDDCIAVKSGKLEMARKYRQGAERHVIRNCLMEFGHGAVTMGSELAAGIRDLSVTKCLFRSTDRGLRIKSRRGRGKDSVITGVVFDNIRMEKVLTPIVINMWYNCCDPDRESEYVWSREKLPVDDRTPHLGSFSFRNMECTGAEVAACYIDALPESPIDRIELENIHISFAKLCRPGVPAMQNFAQERCRLGLYLDNVRQVRLKNVSLSGEEGEALLAGHCGEIIKEGFEAD